MKTAIKLTLAVLVLVLFMASPTQAAQPAQTMQWTFEAEALILHRNQSKGVPVVRTTTGSRLLLGTNNLNFGFRPGARFTLGFHPDPNNTVELLYFGLRQGLVEPVSPVVDSGK